MADTNLPAISSALPADVRLFLDRMRDFVAAAPSSYVKTADLIAAGVITRNKRGVIRSGNVDESSDLPPPAPTGLAVAGAMTNLLWTWDSVTYPNPGYTEVWASGTDDLGTAVIVGTAAKRAKMFPHPVGAGQTRYGWIRFISESGQPGPFNATAGTLGQTSNDPAWMLEVLTDQLSEDQLTAALNTRIDLVDADASVSGSVNARIAYVQGQVSDLLQTQAYDSGTAYVVDDVVTYSGGLYICISNTTGNDPTNATYWTKIGDYTAIADAVAANTADIATVVSDLSAEVTDRETLATQLRGSYTGSDLASLTTGLLYSERTARSDGDGALADDISALSATVDDNTADILSEATARATGDSAVAEQVHVLDSATRSSVETTAYAALRNALSVMTNRARIYTEQTTRTTEDSALAQSITLLDAQVNDAATGLPVTRALLLSDYSTTSSMNSAISSASTTLTSAYEAADSATLSAAGAAAQAYTQSYAYAKASTYTQAEADSAIASASDLLQTQIDDNVASIATNASSIDGVRAIYTVKMDVNGVVSGFGLMSDVADGGAVTSKAILSVDEFAVIAPGRTVGTLASVPFAVLTSPQTINGYAFGAGVYIDGASINDGTIGNAQIGSLSADKITAGDVALDRLTANVMAAVNASVEYLDASQIDTTTLITHLAAISTAYIDDAHIVDGTITFAKIEDTLQSTNYVLETSGWKLSKDGTFELNNLNARGTLKSTSYSAGVSGWAVNADGTAEFNSGTFRGTLDVKSASSGARLEIASTTIKVYDTGGVLRVHIGDLLA